jgi:hypothetical protein
VSEALRLQVEALDLEQLETLSEALLDFSTVDDLVAWLKAHGGDRQSFFETKIASFVIERSLIWSLS